MPTGLILMVLLGCGDGSEACDRVAVSPTSYATMAECNAAIEAVLIRNSDIAYPVIAASCEAGPPRVQIALAAR